MKSGNDNALSFAEQGLEAMGASFPSKEIYGIMNIRDTLLQYPSSARSDTVLGDIERCEAIVRRARELGII